MKYSKLYDISVLLKENPNGNDNNFKKEIFPINIGNEIFNGLELHMNAHSGTHIDAPCHLTPGTKTTNDYPLERFVLPATVINIKDEVSIKVAELKDANLKPGHAVLFKTANSLNDVSTNLFDPGNHVYLDDEALDFIIDKGVTLVGFDSAHGERDAAPDEVQLCPVHSKLFANDIIVLESVTLKHVPVGEYTLCVLPLKIKGVNASPSRAILFAD